MKIYFTASISGRSQYESNYKAIVDTLLAENHKVVSEHILKINRDTLLNETPEQRKNHHKKLNQWISSCDIVVAEVSHSSTSVGYEITIALDKGKPVLALHVPENIPIALEGEPSDKFLLVPYTQQNVKKVISKNIRLLCEKIDIRFNFFITPKLVSYLDWIASNRRVPRSVYIRNLLERDMKNDLEYLSESSEETE